MNISPIAGHDFKHRTASLAGVTLATASIMLKPATWAVYAGPVAPPSCKSKSPQTVTPFLSQALEQTP